MRLDFNTLNKFAKIISPKKEKSTTTTIFGTVINSKPENSPGEILVKLDGSDEYISASSSVASNNGDRVMVEISNHMAVATSNFTDQSASSEEFNDVTTEEDGSKLLDGKKIKVGSIDADKINVEDLFAKDINATGTINGATIRGGEIHLNDEPHGVLTDYKFDIGYTTLYNEGEYRIRNSQYFYLASNMLSFEKDYFKTHISDITEEATHEWCKISTEMIDIGIKDPVGMDTVKEHNFYMRLGTGDTKTELWLDDDKVITDDSMVSINNDALLNFDSATRCKRFMLRRTGTTASNGNFVVDLSQMLAGKTIVNVVASVSFTNSSVHMLFTTYSGLVLTSRLYTLAGSPYVGTAGITYDIAYTD